MEILMPNNKMYIQDHPPKTRTKLLLYAPQSNPIPLSPHSKVTAILNPVSHCFLKIILPHILNNTVLASF